MRALLLPAFLCLVACQAQYNGPESVEHDPVGDRYFVSCTDDNSIRQRAQDGAVSLFVADPGGAPYGLELKGDTLFANVGGGIKGFLTSTGEEVFNVALGASFLNGLTTDGRYLYTSDFSTKRIYKVLPDDASFTILVANTVQTPNGLVWDPVLERLWVGCWGSNARIKSYDRVTGAQLSTFTSALGNIDGITLDCQGRLLVSSWSPARISRFETSFSGSPEIIVGSGLNQPADIDYDAVNARVCVPNAGSNTVVVPDVPACALAMPEPDGQRSTQAVPNPTDGAVRLELALERPEPYAVLTESGQRIAGGTLAPKALLDVSMLAAGTYLVHLPRLGRFVRIVKH
jgi:hypothetical protein